MYKHKITTTLVLLLLLISNKSFSQISEGTYYFKEPGMLGRSEAVLDLSIKDDGDLSINVQETDPETYSRRLKRFSKNIYHDENNGVSTYLLIRDDKNLEYYKMVNNKPHSSFFATQDKENLKALTKTNKLDPKAFLKSFETIKNELTYYYTSKYGYKSEEMLVFSEAPNNQNSFFVNSSDYKKIGDNFYVEIKSKFISAIKILPNEKKVIYLSGYENTQDEIIGFVAQQKTSLKPTDETEKQVDEANKLLLDYISPLRANFFNSLKSTTIESVTVATITKKLAEFYEGYTFKKVKILSPKWNIIRDEYNRILRRELLIGYAIENKETKSAHIIYRFYTQDFDGTGYSKDNSNITLGNSQSEFYENYENNSKKNNLIECYYTDLFYKIKSNEVIK